MEYSGVTAVWHSPRGIPSVEVFTFELDTVKSVKPKKVPQKKIFKYPENLKKPAIWWLMPYTPITWPIDDWKVPAFLLLFMPSSRKSIKDVQNSMDKLMDRSSAITSFFK